MATSQRIVGLTFVLLWIGNVARGAPDMSQTYGGCNQATYPPGDPFGFSLAYILSALETVTPNRPGFDYYATSPYPEAVAYGHAACNPALSYSDCITCINYVNAQMLTDCSSRVRAQLVLHDCRMRYEQYSFTE